MLDFLIAIIRPKSTATAGAALFAIGLCLSACGLRDGPPYFIPGTAELPDCSEAPAVNLDGTKWFDNGAITITSEGCDGTTVGDLESTRITRFEGTLSIRERCTADHAIQLRRSQ